MAEAVPDSTQAAGAAMRQAVGAEQDARRAIVEAEAQAVADIEAARAEARALLNAVPDRIARLRARGASAVEKALSAIRAEEAITAQRLNEAAPPPERDEAAVAEVAQWLTGAGAAPR